MNLPQEFDFQSLSLGGLFHWSVILFVPAALLIWLLVQVPCLGVIGIVVAVIAFRWYWAQRPTTIVRCTTAGFSVSTGNRELGFSTREYDWSDVTGIEYEEFRPVEGSDLDTLEVYAKPLQPSTVQVGLTGNSEMVFKASSDMSGFVELKRIFEVMTPHLRR